MCLGQPVHGRCELAARDAAHKTRLQRILAVEHQHGRLRQRGGVHPLSKVALHEGGAGQRAVAQSAQRQHLAALHGLRVGRHGGHHAAFAQQVGRVVLVFHMDVEGDGLPLGRLRHGVGEPGGQRVGIHTNRQPRGAVLPATNGGQRVGFTQRHLARMAVQRLPGLGGRAGRGAAHQHLAHAFFQQLDALRHRRARDMQHGRRALEAALVDHRGKGVELGRVQLHGWLAILTDR